MPNISTPDFKYYQDKLKKDIDYHDREFIQRINPDLIDDYFEGDPDKETEKTIDRVAGNNLFPTTQTLISQFYPQNPQFIGIPKREEDEMSAKVAAAAMDYYYQQMGAVKENQKAIISAWMYGFGVTKQGWRTEFVQNPPADKKGEGIGKLIRKPFSGTPSMEEKKDRDYIASEGPYLEFVNCKDVYFDSQQPFGKWRFIHQRIPKTLHDIRVDGLYTVDSDFINRFKRGKDDREVVLDLYESWIWLKDGLYVLVSVRDWNRPLRWDKTPYASEGFPYKVLTFNNQVNRIYPVSHMKVAQRLQRFSDYILTLQKQHIEKHKNIDILNGDAFDKDTKERILKNELGLNAFTKDGIPATTAGAHLGGNTIPTDMFAVKEDINGQIKEILSVVGARLTGQSEMETATQENIADYGNQLRTTAIQYSVREFLIAQGRKLLQDLKQFATAPALFKITGLNLIDDTGMPVTEKWVEFATDRNPEILRDIIPQDIDIDVDITNRSRRDLPIVRKQLMEFVMSVVMPLQPMLAQEGVKFNSYRFVKKVAENFDTIGNADQFFDKATPEDMLAAQMQMQGQMPGTAKQEAVEQSATQVPQIGV